MGKDIKNPHDKFFKTMLADRDVAVDFLDFFLPADVKKLIDIGSFQYSNTSFISEELKEYFSDIVLQCPLKDTDEKAIISILIEHKSYPDKFVAIQLLYYLASFYFKQAQSGKKVSPVLPLVFYHGKRKWNIKQISQLIENLPDPLKSYIPYFDVLYIDIKRFDEQQLGKIKNLFLLSSSIVQMQNTDYNAIFIKTFTILEKYDVQEKWNLFQSFVVYLLEIIQFSDEKIQELLESIPKQVKNYVMTTFNAIAAKYKKIEICKGIEKGRLRGI